MANLGDIALQSGNDVPLQTGLGYQRQGLENQGLGITNQINSQHLIALQAENDENARQAQKAADMRDTYSKYVSHQPVPTPQASQPTDQTTQTAQTPMRVYTPPSQPSPGQINRMEAPGYGQSSLPQNLNSAQIVPSLASHPAATDIATHPIHNESLNPDIVMSGQHMPTQTFTQSTPQGPYQTRIDREGFLADWGNQHPEDIEPMRQQFLANDAKELTTQRNMTYDKYLDVLGRMYKVKMQEDDPDAAKASWDTEYNKLKAEGADLSGVPPTYPGKSAFDQLNNQMLDAKDRAKDELMDSKQNEKAINDRLMFEFKTNMGNEQIKLGQEKLQLALEALKQKQDLGGLDLKGISGDAFRASLDPNTANTLDSVALHEMELPRSPQTVSLLAAAKRLNPDVNMTEAGQIQKELGKVAPNSYGGIGYFSRKFAEHLNTAQSVDPKLPSANVNIMSLGSAYNATLGTLEGNPNRQAWDTAHTAMIDELKKSLKGSPGGETEALRDLANLKWNSPPDQKRAVYAVSAKLVLGNDSSAMQGRKAAFGHLDTGDSFLDGNTLGVIANSIKANDPNDVSLTQLPSPAGSHQRNSISAAQQPAPNGKTYPMTPGPAATSPVGANDILKLLRGQ